MTPTATLESQNFQSFTQAVEAMKFEEDVDELNEDQLRAEAGPPPLFLRLPSRETLLRLIIRSTAFASIDDILVYTKPREAKGSEVNEDLI
jgi:hypothetical protein